MGQYHLTVNLDKREFVNPHALGAGLKLWEQLANNMGPGKALVILLAHPDQRGGGDFDVDQNWHGPERKDMTKVGEMPEEYPAIAKRTIGRWRGDRIAIIGDYAEDGDIPGYTGELKISEIYGLCRGSDEEGEGTPFTDVTADVRKVIEHELNGVFLGDGWCSFVEEGTEVSRWEGERPDQKRVTGKVTKIDETSVTVKWPKKVQKYPRDQKPDFF